MTRHECMRRSTDRETDRCRTQSSSMQRRTTHMDIFMDESQGEPRPYHDHKQQQQHVGNTQWRRGLLLKHVFRKAYCIKVKS